MPPVPVITPHTGAEIKAFARELKIPEERARYIESLRPRYLLWEHDYIHTRSPREGRPTETR